MKKIIKNKKGFTLLEMLLVLAMISILAGTPLVGMGYQRQRARATSAMKSLTSAVPYAVECYLKSKTINDPVVDPNLTICEGSPVKWPDISGTNCSYYDFDGDKWRLSCDGDIYFACFVDKGSCCYVEDDSSYNCQ